MDGVTLNDITLGVNAVGYTDSLQKESGTQGQTQSCKVRGWNSMVKEQL